MDVRNMLSLYEVLQVIDGFDTDDRPLAFNISFCTLDKAKQTGGKRISMENAIKVVGKRKDKIILPGVPKETKEKLTKNPNHYLHQTRNIMVKGTQSIRKIHIRLIERFNGKIVYW